MNATLLILLIAAPVTFASQGFGPNRQAWGYVTVRHQAHMFWWLHLTTAQVDRYTDRPLIIWVQGGPGIPASGRGNFAEIGPLDVDLNPRPSTWVKNYNVLFVDSPVGTGFSYVDSNNSYAKSNTQIAKDFVILLRGVCKVLPDVKRIPAYIFGQSYGGKMAAEIALRIDEAIREKILKMNLKGVALGAPWISPRDATLSWAPYLLNLGVLDQNGFEKIQELAVDTANLIQVEEFSRAEDLWRSTLLMVLRFTESIDFYNVLKRMPNKDITNSREEIDRKLNIIMNSRIKEALEIKREWVDARVQVYNYLSAEFLKPVTNLVEHLLNTTDLKVAVYNGQLDFIVNVPGTTRWVDELKFKNTITWKAAQRRPIHINDTIEGYVKKSGNLAFYWINRAGHSVSTDNPEAMDFILDDFIK